MNNKNKLGTEPVQKLLIQFAVPSIISMIVSAFYNIVDQFFIGNSVGELGNAATNVAFPLSTSCLAIALLFGVGGAAAFNLNMGRGKAEQAIRYVGNAAVLLLLSGVILCVVTNIFLEPLLILFGSPVDVLPYAMEYTQITSFGFPFLILSSGGGHLVRADGNPRAAMVCNISGAIINTILDAIFVFGLGMGMKGAAMATVIGQFVGAVLTMNYLLRFKTMKLKKEHFALKIEYSTMVAKLGISNFFNQIAMMIVQITLNKSLTYYGALSTYGESIPLACAGIISKMGMVFFSICIGLSHGMQPIASFNYGAENYKRVKEVYLNAIKIGTCVSTIGFLVFQLFPRQIIDMFGKSQSPEYYQFAIRYFKIYMFFIFLNAIQPMSSNLFTAIGKPAKGVFLALTRQIIFLLPLIVILPLFLGIDGIMYAAPVADIVAVIVSVIFVRKEFIKMNELMKIKEKKECELLS